MPNSAKVAILSLSLLIGAVAAASAQTDNVAALPPTAPAASTPIARSAPLPGPDPGKLWSMQERQTQPVTPSPKMEGPDPGKLWSTPERQTRAVEPSPPYPGPKPH